MNLRSIRWRIVASTMVVALLTVVVVGVLAQLLVSRTIARSEQDLLHANAAAIARQAAPLMVPVPDPSGLAELAQTSAFLLDARVAFSDAGHEPLADSGPQAPIDQFVWLGQDRHLALDVDAELAELRALERELGGMVISVPGAEIPLVQVIEGAPGIAPATSITAPRSIVVLRRHADDWGNRLDFETVEVLAGEGVVSAPESDHGVIAGHLTVQGEHLPFLPGGVKARVVATLMDPAGRAPASVRLPVGDPTAPQGYVTLFGAADVGAEALAATRRALALAAAAAMVLAAGVGLVVGRGLTAPISNLTEATERMSGGDLTARAPARGRDEIAQLARQFNRMAARLEQSFADLSAERDALRRFVTDASHELRTPITALRSFNELLRAGAAEDPGTRDEFLAESGEQLDRLEWITRNLLDLSRLEMGLVDLDLAPYDVGELVESACDPLRPAAQAKDIGFSTTPPDPAVAVTCDADRIRLALTNLVDNAVKYTGPGGTVTVDARVADDAIVIVVADTGAGIPDADLPHVFDRFYRGGAGADGPTGSGLGLAIARAIVEAHGGTVSVESTVGQGTRFTTVLPRTEAS